jgi:dTDP-glucose 4,6-dehydratase
MLQKSHRKRLLVTGGAGFIGSAFIRFVLKETDCSCVVNLDLLTYAGNIQNVSEIEKDPRYFFVQGNICDEALVAALCQEHEIDTLVHFAAESHVDRSIVGPKDFFETNVRGTLCLLEVVRRFPHIHFHHVSTDEVYGSIESGKFTELSRYAPNSPYAASKAASDHFVRAYANTYGISTTLSHSSNNYGPYQFTEKFIPRMITHCLARKPLPIYGTGENIRDWLFVEDHAEAIWMILQKGKRSEVYDIGGECEKKTVDVIQEIIQIVARIESEDPSLFQSLIRHVNDRPGHDFRYALDCSKVKKEMGWKPRYDFSSALSKTVEWYVDRFANEVIV